MDLITRTAINGSWFNFYLCSAGGTVSAGPGTRGAAARSPARRGGAADPESSRSGTATRSTIGAISLTVIAAMLFLAFNAQRCRSSAAARSTRRSSPRPPGSARRRGPGRRRQGRQGESRRAGGRRRARRVPGRTAARLRRRPARRSRSRPCWARSTSRWFPRGRRARPRARSRLAHRRPYDVVEAFADLSTTARTSTPRSWPRLLEVLADTFADTPDEVRTSLRAWPGCRHHRLARPAAAQLLGHPQVTQRAGRPERGVQAAPRPNMLLRRCERRALASTPVLTTSRSWPTSSRGWCPRTARRSPRPAEAAQRGRRPQPTGRPRDENNFAPFVRVFANTLGNGRWFDTYVENLVPVEVVEETKP